MPQDTIPSISVSDLSKYYMYDCDKLLQFISNQDLRKRQSLQETNKNQDTKKKDNFSFSQALKRNGLNFESKITNVLKDVIVDCTRKSQKEVKNLLLNAKNGQIFYQMKFDVPEEFYDEIGIKNIIKLKSFIPDFIEVEEENDEKKLIIYDAKASKSVRLSHQFQVASYAYILKFVVQKINGLSISRTGGIYLPSPQSQPPFQLQSFRVDLLIPRIKKFFRTELPQIVTASNVFWYYTSRCKTCDYVDVCREDAEGTISMIPYLSFDKAVDLETFIKDWKSKGNKSKRSSSDDIEDLVKCIDKLNVKDEESETLSTRINQIIKYNNETKSSPYLDVAKTKTAQFIGIPTMQFPLETDHNLLITISLDPISSRPFGWGMCLYTDNGKTVWFLRHAESISNNDESPKSFTSLMSEFVTRLKKCLEYLARVQSRACVFVYSQQEKIAIQDALLELITTNQHTISSTTQHRATRCLFNLFEDSSLLLASRNVGSGDVTKVPEEWREFPRLIVLEHAIKENIAIGVPGFYRFIDVWQQLVKPNLNDQELLKSFNVNIEKIDIEDIYALWASGENSVLEINKLHLLRVDFGNAVIGAYYKLLNKFTRDINSILIYTPPIFTFTEIKTFRYDYLGKLYFFKQFEAVTRYAQIKSDRVRDFIQGEAVYGVKLRFEKFNKKVDADWSVKFTVLDGGNESYSLEPSTLREFILVEDNLKGVSRAIQFPDMKYQNNHLGSPLPIVGICDVDKSGPQKRVIHLKGTFEKNMKDNPVKTYRLYKRFFDFNLNRVLAMLTEIYERSDNKSVFMDLLKNPNEWDSRSFIKDGKFKKSALKTIDSFSMSPSQKEISTKLLDRRLQVIFGPPGSGKSYFLALFITWYLSTIKSSPESANVNKNYMIGLTAFTKAAIVNLLEKIASIQKRHNKTNDFNIITLIKGLDKQGFEVCEADKLLKRVTGCGATVVGGTIWDWHKVREDSSFDWAGCDIMIIDEGSQVLVSDAAIAIECINPETGKLIVAGDHMQLGPIINNTYPMFPPNHPPIFGSIQQCLMRKKDGSVLQEQDFFLKDGINRDFGPFITQLKENWRMNEELNNFFQRIYGDDYISNPNRQIIINDSELSNTEDPQIRKILSPDSAITLVKLSIEEGTELNDGLKSSDKFLQAEVEIAEKITSAYDSLSATRKEKLSLFIVTPYHRQRLAILKKCGNKQNINLQVDTVEKMQGREADIVISCFGFSLNKASKESVGFIFDKNRWNVAISRAKCKVIVITTNEVLYPEVFANKEISNGWLFLNMVEEWAQEKPNGVIEWVISSDDDMDEN